MRTTVTLDHDVERMLRDLMHRSRQSFKATLNAALRVGLGAVPREVSPTRFVVHARPMRLRAGIDPASLNSLADEVDVEAFLDAASRAGNA
jgi:hypothetical protein